ncbi:hypothetical protein FQN49_000881, partial [Arthroderma sp. PD_2]
MALSLIYALLPTPTLSETRKINADNWSSYCFTFEGNLTAKFDVADDYPEFNFDGSKRCPRSWDFNEQPEPAVLRLCPPIDHRSITKNTSLALDVALKATGDSLLRHFDQAIREFKLYDMLVTNGSVPGPYIEGVVNPAVLAPDKQSSNANGTWTIKGTEQSLFEEGSFDTEDRMAWLSCERIRTEMHSYCGTNLDLRGQGCWQSDWVVWTPDSGNLNYTFRFDNSSAEVNISTKHEYMNSSNDYTGSYSHVKFSFIGSHNIPESKYYSEYVIRLISDDTGMPALLNITDGAKYFARNSTFVGDGGASRYGGLSTNTLALA